MPTDWRQQPLRQLAINGVLDVAEYTWRLKNEKDFNWTGEFNATQLDLVSWIDGSE